MFSSTIIDCKDEVEETMIYQQFHHNYEKPHYSCKCLQRIILITNLLKHIKGSPQIPQFKLPAQVVAKFLVKSL